MDSDVILQEPIKDQTTGEMICVLKKLGNRLKACGIYPKHHMLDNKILEEFRETIKNKNIVFELVHPHDHYRNIVEKEVQVDKAKDQLVSVLNGVDPNFPMYLWDRVLP